MQTEMEGDRQIERWTDGNRNVSREERKAVVLTLFSNNCNSQERGVFLLGHGASPAWPSRSTPRSWLGNVCWFGVGPLSRREWR